MQVTPLSIEGVWSVTPILRPDDRGVFLESYKASELEPAIGHPFTLRQMNISSSRRGTVRGVHFADVPPSQAKYVQCFSGRILDVVVDIRVGSPTFGRWDAIELDDTTRTGLYISEGLGHAFCALSEQVSVGYLCSEPFAPDREHGITPLDPALGLPWPDLELLLSPKDEAAPTLGEARDQGLLPRFEDCQAFTASLAR